jgi:hypothetical protein
MTRKTKRDLVISLIGVGLCITAALMLKGDKSFNNPYSQNVDGKTSDALILGLIGVTLFLWPWVWRFVSSVYDNVRVATARTPSPSEIHQTLTAYYGREATIEEVAAAQSIFAHQRNEAAVQAAIGVGAFLLFTDRL